MASECGRRSPGWAGKTATPISVSASTFRGHVGGVMLTSLDTYPVQKVDDVALAGAYQLRRDGRSGLLRFGLCLLGWVQARSCSPHNPLVVVFLVPRRKRRTITNVLSRARECMYDFPKPRHTMYVRTTPGTEPCSITDQLWLRNADPSHSKHRSNARPSTLIPRWT